MALRAPSLNKLLAALPLQVFERLEPHLELVPLKLGASVYEAGARQSYVYFPVDSIVSLLYVMKDGASAEIAIVGNEGLVAINSCVIVRTLVGSRSALSSSQRHNCCSIEW